MAKSGDWLRGQIQSEHDRLYEVWLQSPLAKRASAAKRERFRIKGVGGTAYVDLRGVDLSGADLRGLQAPRRGFKVPSVEFNLTADTNLSGADLSGADLSGQEFLGGDLSGANLRGANLSETVFGGTDLRGANLSGAKLWMTNFTNRDWPDKESDLTDANLTNVVIYQPTFRNAILRGATIIGAPLDEKPGGYWGAEINFSGADLRDSRISIKPAFGAMDALNLRNADLTGADMRGTRPSTDPSFLRGATLSDAVVDPAFARRIMAFGYDVSGVIMSGS